MLKKILIGIGVVFVVGISCFLWGFYSSKSIGSSELAIRTKEFESIISAAETRNTELENLLDTANGTINSIRIENTELTENNRRIFELSGNIERGIINDQGSVQRISEGIDYYIKQAENE
jgi:small-conductance mechanosensitive channel